MNGRRSGYKNKNFICETWNVRNTVLSSVTDIYTFALPIKTVQVRLTGNSTTQDQ